METLQKQRKCNQMETMAIKFSMTKQLSSMDQPLTHNGRLKHTKESVTDLLELRTVVPPSMKRVPVFAEF